MSTRKRYVNRSGRVLLGVLLLAILLGFLGLTSVDKTPYAQTPEGKATFARLDSLAALPNEISDKPLLVGWGKANITPDEPVATIGYGRNGPYRVLADSVYVRCFLFEQGGERIALISYDLLLVAQTLADALRAKLDSSDLGLTGIYFSATHTHKSFGGFGSGIAGSFLLGGEDTVVIGRVMDQTMAALADAESMMDTAKVGFGRVNGTDYVKNRLIEGGEIDPWIRMVRFEQDNGKTALLWTYAAHATCLWARLPLLSGDYPTLVCHKLEADSTVDFALYCAGAVGSHSQLIEHTEYDPYLLDYKDSLAALIRSGFDSIQATPGPTLALRDLPLDLREPQVRVTQGLCVRPWVFEMLNGEVHPKLQILALGDILLVSTPCDFSGMLMAPLDSLAETKGRHLLVTSFNSDYMGYITPDRYYKKHKKETWDMNWYAPGSGSWMQALIAGLIEKAE